MLHLFGKKLKKPQGLHAHRTHLVIAIIAILAAISCGDGRDSQAAQTKRPAEHRENILTATQALVADDPSYDPSGQSVLQSCSS